MAVNYRIEPDERIVYLATTGESSLAEWREAMLAALSDSSYQLGFNFLSDRRLEKNMPDTQFASGAADFLKLHYEEVGSYRWAAVSNNAAVYGMQRMFSIFSEMNGVPARVFTEFEEARSWLRSAE